MGVVVLSPLLDQDRSLFSGIEDLHIQQLVSELAIERLAIAALPGTARLYEQRADVQPFKPISNGISEKTLAQYLIECGLAGRE